MLTDTPALKELFLEALAIPPDELASWLSQSCGEDAPLRRRLELMLEAHAAPHSLLDRTANATADCIPRFGSADSFAVGLSIGPYKALEAIGEGGFGIVYKAEQTQPVRRIVAVKAIKPGMDSRQVVARFEAERQALAVMNHPNIAQVFDGGATPEGQPYFVMELVEGEPITDFCDRHRYTTRQRLELFQAVCQAIQHAHQKGIIHRDLKPSNVLVAARDSVPIVKVIDFGIAKALGQGVNGMTSVTQFPEIIGTPLYMSPEQAGRNGLDIDTRSDIYSLGAMLYELLTGTTPFDQERLSRASHDEICRVIREEDPPKPSARLRESKRCSQPLAGHRRSEPIRSCRLVRFELDWVVMKAMEKDRGRRYATAGELLNDLQRYLSHEPVLAHPPSTAYRLRKLLRRHSGVVIAVGLILLTLIGGFAGTTLGLVRAEEAKRALAVRAEGERKAMEDARTRLAQAEKGTEILAAIFRDLDPIVAEKEGLSSHDLLCRRLGDAARQLDGEAVGDRLAVARLQHLLGVSLRELGEHEEAEVVLLKARKTRERLLGARDLDTVATLHHLALVYKQRSEYARAQELLDQVIELRSSELGSRHLDTLASLHHLAALHQARGEYSRAETLCGEVLAERTRQLGVDDLDTLASKHLLAVIHFKRGELASAEQLYQEVLAVRSVKLGPDHPDNLRTRHHLGLVYRGQCKHELAISSLEEVVAVRSAKLGADDPATLRAKNDLLATYMEAGEFAAAEPMLKGQLASDTARVGADHIESILSRDALANAYSGMKEFEQAISLLEESLKYRTPQLPVDAPEVLGRRVALGAAYCDAGQFDKGLELIEQVRDKKVQDPHPAWIRAVLLRAYLQAGELTEAAELIEDCVREERESSSRNSDDLALALIDNGALLIQVKEYDQAEVWLLEAHRTLSESRDRRTNGTTAALDNARSRLIDLYEAWDKPESAAAWRAELSHPAAEFAHRDSQMP